MSKNATRRPIRNKADAEMTAKDFEALPDAEKERIWQEINSTTTEQLLAESRPLNAGEREQWRRFKRKLGRPRIGKGVKVVSLSVERDLLQRADTFAKREGISRTELFTRGLLSVLPTHGGNGASQKKDSPRK